MKKILSITFIVLCISLKAQNTHLDYKYSLKVCNLSRFERTYWTERSDQTNHHDHHDDRYRQVFHPVVAFQWRSKRNNFHELELTDLKWDHAESDIEMRHDSLGHSIFVKRTRVTQTAVSMHYEYTFVFFKKKEYSLVPTLGIASAPYYERDHFFPGSNSVFASKETNIGIRAMVTPGLSWFFSERFFADLKIPVCIGNTRFFIHDRKNDPTVPQDEQVIYALDFNAIPQMLSARLGIGIRL